MKGRKGEGGGGSDENINVWRDIKSTIQWYKINFKLFQENMYLGCIFQVIPDPRAIKEIGGCTGVFLHVEFMSSLR